MPFGLAPLLERLKPLEVSTPLKLGKGFCMVELLKVTPSKLDESTADMLLKEQFKLWVSAVVEVLDADLCSMTNS
jgi:parvulin-like peptidyl-prolyl isomerase